MSSDPDARVTILFFEGCPNHQPAVALARAVAAELAPSAVIEEVEVHDNDEARDLRFLGSPTIQVNGQDIEPEACNRTDYAMSCRMYAVSGMPPRELIEAALTTEVRS